MQTLSYPAGSETNATTGVIREVLERIYGKVKSFSNSIISAIQGAPNTGPSHGREEVSPDTTTGGRPITYYDAKGNPISEAESMYGNKENYDLFYGTEINPDKQDPTVFYAFRSEDSEGNRVFNRFDLETSIEEVQQRATKALLAARKTNHIENNLN